VYLYSLPCDWRKYPGQHQRKRGWRSLLVLLMVGHGNRAVSQNQCEEGKVEGGNLPPQDLVCGVSRARGNIVCQTQYMSWGKDTSGSSVHVWLNGAVC